MDYDAQLKLQAFLDGELPEAEAKEVANWLARDSEAASLLAELRNTRQAMAGFEAGIKLPESREFYWSKIAREIERLETPAPAPVSVPLIVRLRRLLMPATAIALLVLGGLMVTNGVRPRGGGMETALADSGAFTYHDYSSGATLVWLSYPAEDEVADDEEMGTID
jgi:anti-sigma factor RsiW